MASFRIVCRPCADNIEAKIYDVEEIFGMLLPFGGEAYYWNFVETFNTLEQAERYAEKLVSYREVLKEYN